MEDNFPVGLRVLVVDDNPTSLKIIEKMMIKCNYQVTTSTSARDALSILHHNLKKKKSILDLVVSEVHLPDMDGFKLLEQIRLETDVPVIVMSFEYEMSDVLKGIKHGACDYLIKPIPLEGVKTMWQHVVRKRWNHRKKLEKLRIFDNGISQDAPLPSVASLSSVNEDTWRSSNKSKEDEDEVEEKDDTCTGKRRRVVWSAELHQKFVSVVEQLGVEKAVPKKILQLMDTPGITRENVASHLQKYRLYLRRANGGPTPQNQVGRYVNSSHEGSARKTSPVEALDITLLDQLLVPSTPQMQPVGVLSNNSALITDQNDPFKHNTNTFHGFSGTAIDPVQLAYLKHQQVQNVRKMSPQPYILSSNGSAIFNSNMGAVYNSMVPVQFPQPKPSPVYNHAMATQLVQLPLTSNGFLLNAATLLPGMLQDEGRLDTAASQIPTANTVSKKMGFKPF